MNEKITAIEYLLEDDLAVGKLREELELLLVEVKAGNVSWTSICVFILRIASNKEVTNYG